MYVVTYRGPSMSGECACSDNKMAWFMYWCMRREIETYSDGPYRISIWIGGTALDPLSGEDLSPMKDGKTFITLNKDKGYDN